LTLPVLAAMLLLAYLDLRYGQQFLGGSGGVYDRIAWVFWQPTLYVFAVPALGIVADVVPVFAQRRHKRHRAAMGMLGLAAALGFGAWAQLGATVDGSATPAPWLYEGPWIAVGFLAVVPLLGLLGLWTGTLAAGRVRLGTPLLLAQPAGLLILLGVAAGAATVIEDLELAGTSWMAGQATLVTTGAVLAALAGVAFWAPKLYGQLLGNRATRLGGFLVFLGALVAGVAQAAAGLLDQPQLPGTTADAVSAGDLDTVEVLELVAGIGLAAVAAGLLVVGLALARRRSADPGDDPWAGHTLEWATSSPPPIGNFATLPDITSEAPVYDARHAAPAADETEAPA